MWYVFLKMSGADNGLRQMRGSCVRPWAITADAQGRVYLGGSSAWGLPLSRTAAQMVLLAASKDGLLSFAPSDNQRNTARFRFDTLSAADKANLAILVTAIGPENNGAHGLAGFMLEVSGLTALADTHFEKAGRRVQSEFEKLFGN